MDLKEKTVKKHVLFEGKIVTLRRDEAMLPDGKPCTREVVEHPGGAAILAVREGKIALVKQFRYAYMEELFEIPAGKLERGEDAEKAALRELSEETGLTAERVCLRFVLYPSPGYTDEKIYIFEAEGLREGDAHPDGDEFLDVRFVPVEEVLEMIRSDKIRDAKTIAAVLDYSLRTLGK